jgi:hypothetical protein
MLAFIIVFIIVLWVYIIIYREVVVSNDLEIYELNGVLSKDKLEEVNDYKQCFKLELPDNIKNILNEQDIINNLEMNAGFDVNITKVRNKLNNNEEKYLPMRLAEAVELIKKDNSYIIQNNSEFLKETGNEKIIKECDMYLRPYMCISKKYDNTIMGSNCITDLKYNTSKRTYLYISSGQTDIILIPPKYTKYLDEINDIENNENLSILNPFDKDNMDNEERKKFDKIKSLKISLNQGECVSIPSYWWFIIKANAVTDIKQFNYDVVSSKMSHLWNDFISMLQRSNMYHKIYKSQ